MAKRTPLFNKHLNLNAKMIDFSGYDMPVQYGGIKQEHLCVREAAGLFDVSHMGEFFISGPQAMELVQEVTANDASLLKPGKAQYSVMCNDEGGIADDLLVYMLERNLYMLVVNAANIGKDREWIRSKNRFDAELDDRSDRMALLAVQGPASVDLLAGLTELDLLQMDSFSFANGTVAGERDVLVSATGYTGEKGFELYIDTDSADPAVIWDALLIKGERYGLQPAGLGARDTLRLEMGLALYGNDLTNDTSPLEAGLGWLTRFEKGDFIGSDALRKQKEAGVKRKLAGFVIGESRQIPRSGYEIRAEDGTKIGFVTSGTQSFSLGKGIGMGYLPVAFSSEGTLIHISIRKKLVPAVVARLPFIKK